MVRERKNKRSSREECQNMYGSFEAKGSPHVHLPSEITQDGGIPDRYMRYYVLSSFFLSLK